MIGALQQVVSSASEPPPPEFSAFITPSNAVYQSSNGSYTTPSFEANVTGGAEPFTYEWSVTDGNATIVTPDSNKTRFTLSGYNTIKFSIVNCKITDNDANEINAESSVTVQFGNQIGPTP